jgi:hypothetical protein
MKAARAIRFDLTAHAGNSDQLGWLIHTAATGLAGGLLKAHTLYPADNTPVVHDQHGQGRHAFANGFNEGYGRCL